LSRGAFLALGWGVEEEQDESGYCWEAPEDENEEEEVFFGFLWLAFEEGAATGGDGE